MKLKFSPFLFGAPGDVVYAERPSWDASSLYVAAATLDPALVGAAQQMFEDNQFFSSLRDQMKESGFRSTAGLLDTPDQYDLLKAQPPSRLRYGPYLIGMNTTKDKTFTLAAPAGIGQARELVSGKTIKLKGPIQVQPMSTVVLYVGAGQGSPLRQSPSGAGQSRKN